MIAASEPLEFVPHGRTVVARHLTGPAPHSSATDSSLLHRLTACAIRDDGPPEDADAEFWLVREVRSGTTNTTQISKDDSSECEAAAGSFPRRMDVDGSAVVDECQPVLHSSAFSAFTPLDPQIDGVYEEELYTKGRTAVWSKGLLSSPSARGSSSERRETLACLTCDTPIRHALFCEFRDGVDNGMLLDALGTQLGPNAPPRVCRTAERLPGGPLPTVLLLTDNELRALAVDGREYVVALPFLVRRAWPSGVGVLLEKDAAPPDRRRPPRGFSSDRTFLASDSTRFTSMSASASACEPPLPTCFSLAHPLDEIVPVVMKSPNRGLHYYDDAELRLVMVASDPSLALAYDRRLGTHSLWRVRHAMRQECLAVCPDVNASLTFLSQSYEAGAASRIGRSVGPARGLAARLAADTTSPRSRPDSPLASAFRRQGLSPHASLTYASHLSEAAPCGPASLPLYPRVCLDHVWTDAGGAARDAPDTAAFLHTDLVGREYLCYAVDESRLQMVRLQRGDVGIDLVVGAVETITARHAVPLPRLAMFALIDEAGNIMLRSGLNVVGKVHVGGVLARLIDSPYSRRGGLVSPFPRRSSLLPSRAADAVPLDDSALHLLSPVPHAPPVPTAEHADNFCASGRGLATLRDAAGSRLTLRADNGPHYRIALPAWASSALVSRCLATLAATLVSDLAVQLLIDWYGVRNAPGTRDASPHREWAMFTELVYVRLGRDPRRLAAVPITPPLPTDARAAPKKQRTSDDGSDEDWQRLLAGPLHIALGDELATRLRLKRTAPAPPPPTPVNVRGPCERLDRSSPLVPHTVHILYAFHLLYEDMKLNALFSENLRPLAVFLYRLAVDVGAKEYASHYWSDFPAECDERMRADIVEEFFWPAHLARGPPSVFAWLRDAVHGAPEPYPFLPGVNTLSRDIVEAVYCATYGVPGGVQRMGITKTAPQSAPDPACPADPEAAAAATVLLLCRRGITPRDVDVLPPAVALLLTEIFARCRVSPPAGWPAAAYHLVRREDLARAARTPAPVDILGCETAYTECEDPPATPPAPTPASGAAPASDDAERDTATGMEHLDTRLLRLLYPRDHRSREAFAMLQSSQPVSIELTQRPEVSDHEFIEEQEKHLYAVSTRTTALPTARGMVTLRTAPVVATEGARVPPLCVAGRGPPPRCSAVELPADAAHALHWPAFHNGVAAGLALVPHPAAAGAAIRASWVLYNRPKPNATPAADLSTEHAGFLMGLGLNGHLKDMPFMNIYEYLVKCHEMTSIGLLLGLAATYRGTMDAQATKMMSIHLEPLLPPTAVELDIQHNILVAALFGVGLLYQGTAHAHYAHVLLHEIGKPPGPEMENCVEREGYALAAGLALGLVCVGAHTSAPPHLARTLRHYMLGGARRHSPARRQPRAPAWAVREGGALNVDVTAPGATLALGLLHLGSGDTAVAAWLAPPPTARLLHHVRPDLLMLRVIARGLVLWDRVEPDEEWVEAQVPEYVRAHCFVEPTDARVDYEAVSQAYCNIVAGACFCLGLRYAGSGHEIARDALLHYARLLLRLGSRSVAELAGRATLESCLCAVVLAAAMVMAGRGDVAVMRLVRRLRARLPHAAHHPLTHGGQMAVHCALGLLFLGGGRCTLSTSRTAVAALVAAFFPKFPTHSEDNRYHLQALRHMYVLATEPRLLLFRELRTGHLCAVHLQLTELDGIVREVRAPFLLPELDRLREVRLRDPRYWPLVFKRDSNWHQLRSFLEQSRCVEVKQRAVCLSYADDPNGLVSLRNQTLTLRAGGDAWAPAPRDLRLLTADPAARTLTRHYLRTPADAAAPNERALAERLAALSYLCLAADEPTALPVAFTFLKIMQVLGTRPAAYHVWQLKLLFALAEWRPRSPIGAELALSFKQSAARLLDEWERPLGPLLDKYLCGSRATTSVPARSPKDRDTLQRQLSAYVLFHELPQGDGATHPLTALLCDSAPAYLASLALAYSLHSNSINTI